MSCFESIQVHVPYTYLEKKIEFFLAERLNPEIYFPRRALNRFLKAPGEGIVHTIAESSLNVTFHGPFYDLSPGAMDSDFRALTVRRVRDTLTVARYFNPAAIVFHPGFDPLRFQEHTEVWLKNSLKTWKEILALADTLPGTWLLLENIFESRPETIEALLSRLPSPPFGFCFDTGHFQVFSEVSLGRWFEVLGPYMREVHLHDNFGSRDEHLAPGDGIFDFPSLFKMIGNYEIPTIGTIEAHNEKDLRRALKYLDTEGVLVT